MPDTLGIVDSIKQPSMPKILRITDIVKATGLSKSTLLRYEEEGKFPRAKRDGRKWRYYSEQERNRIVATLKKLKLI